MFNNVASGTHSIEITDSRGATPVCSLDIANIVLTNPAPIVATIDETFKALSCSSPPAAQIQVSSITGGSGSYSYSLDGTTYTSVGSLPFTLDFANAGNYTLSVRNSGTDDCTRTFPFTIAPLLEIDDVVVTSGNIDCTTQTTPVTLSATPSVSAPVSYEYEVSPDPSTNVGGSSTGFSATTSYTFTNGITYRVTARRTDSGCTNFTDYSPAIIDEISISSAIESQPVTCNGGSDGILSFTVDAVRFPNFTFEVVGPSPATTVVLSGSYPGDPLSVSNLSQGVYTITVTDSNGLVSTNCIDTATVTITEPNPITFTPILEQICSNNRVRVTNVLGGNGSVYTYTITHPSNGTNLGPQPITAAFDGVANDATPYVISVFDNTGVCVSTQNLAVTALPDVVLSITSDELCLDDGTTSVTVEITSGTPDYFYSVIRDGTQVVGNTNLGSGNTTINESFTQSGTYIITVFDSVGCSETETIVIEPAVSLVVTQVSDVTCDALGNPVPAEFSFVVNGGYSPYDIDVIFNSGGATNHITNGVSPFANYTATPGAGSYEFVVTDSSGCSFTTVPFTVTPPAAPTITAPTVDVSCDGDLGTAVITVDGTESPYEIDFNGAGYVPIVGSQISFTNLSEAVYNFTIRSSRGCLYLSTVEIAAPDPLTEVSRVETPVSCGGSTIITDLGAIDFVLSGGTSSYTYNLVRAEDLFTVPYIFASTDASTPNPVTTGTSVTFSGLDFGQYYIIVEDANGCEETFGPFDIFSPPNDLLQNISISATCPGGVTFDIDVQGGVGTDGSNPPPGFDIRIVGEPVPGLGAFVPLNDVMGVAGTTTTDASTPIRDHRYTNLEFNRTYILEVRDNATNCLYQELVDPVTPPSEPDILNLSVTGVSCNETPALDDGSISFDIANYDGSVTSVSWEVFAAFTNVSLGAGYSGNATGLTGAPVPVLISNFPPGQYYVRVREDDGTLCPNRADFTIDIPDELASVISVQTPANSCGTNAEVILSTTGGTPFTISSPSEDGYRYALVADGAGDPGVYTLLSNRIDLGNVAQDLDIWVADSNNCSFGPIDVTVVVNPLPTITATFVDDCAYDASNIIDVDATGLGTLLYQIDGGTQVTGSIDNENHQFLVSTSGSYMITVRDDSGCTSTTTVDVYNLLEISASFTVAPTCQTPSGTITTTVSSGAPIGTLTYQLQNNLGAPTGNTSGDASGVYTGVAAGDYIVQVTDTGRGSAPFCSFTTTVGIIAPEPPVFDLPATNGTISCNGATDGIIDVMLTGTSFDIDAVYSYEITAPIVRPAQSSPLFTNLGPGSYTVLVTVTQANGSGTTDDVICTETATYTIDDVTVPSFTLTQVDQFDCDGNSNASFEIASIAGGNGGAYTATLTRPDGTIVTNVSLTVPSTVIEAPLSGDYDVQLFDQNNCPSVVTSINIPAYTPMTAITFVQNQAINCNPSPGGDEIIRVEVVGGSGDYSFQRLDNAVDQNVLDFIDSPAGVNFAEFFNLPNLGTYTFRVIDQGVGGLGFGCDIVDTYEVPEFDFVEVNITTSSDLVCFGDGSGSLSFEVLNYTDSFEYDIIDVSSGTAVVSGVSVGAGFTNPIVQGGLSSGEYEVVVRETSYPFCDETSGRERIDEPEALQFILGTIVNSNCSEDGSCIRKCYRGYSTVYV